MCNIYMGRLLNLVPIFFLGTKLGTKLKRIYTSLILLLSVR